MRRGPKAADGYSVACFHARSNMKLTHVYDENMDHRLIINGGEVQGEWVDYASIAYVELRNFKFAATTWHFFGKGLPEVFELRPCLMHTQDIVNANDVSVIPDSVAENTFLTGWEERRKRRAKV